MGRWVRAFEVGRDDEVFYEGDEGAVGGGAGEADEAAAGGEAAGAHPWERGGRGQGVPGTPGPGGARLVRARRPLPPTALSVPGARAHRTLRREPGGARPRARRLRPRLCCYPLRS